MKIKITEYCFERIDGRILILDAGKVMDVSEKEAFSLIDKNLAIEINELGGSNTESPTSFENKMIDVVYKKRGRPRKEVKDGNI